MKVRVGKIRKGLLALALVSVFWLGPVFHNFHVYEFSLIQKLGGPGSGDFKEGPLGYFIPTSHYFLSTAATFLKAVHSATISAFDDPLSRPSLVRLILPAHGKFPAAVLVASVVNVRAPPLPFPGRSIL